MEYTIALGVWAVCVAAPCVMSWMAGDMVGSARTRRLYAPGLEGSDNTRDSAAAYLVEQWRLGAPVSLDAGAARGAGPDQTPRGWHAGAARAREGALPFVEQAKEAERRRMRREALAAMPDLGNLRAHAEAIRQNDAALLTQDWDASAQDPDMGRVLRHYENSVQELKRSRGLDSAAAFDEWPRIVRTKTKRSTAPALTGSSGPSRF